MTEREAELQLSLASLSSHFLFLALEPFSSSHQQAYAQISTPTGMAVPVEKVKETSSFDLVIFFSKMLLVQSSTDVSAS